MSFQILTYSGTHCNSYVYFCFTAQYFDTEKVTQELNIQPTKVMIKKEPVPKVTSWDYRITAGNNPDIKSHADKLLDIFVPKIEIINQLKQQLKLNTRLQFVIDIDIDPNTSTPYFPFDQRTIDFLYNTGTVVDFDMYKADTLGLLNKLK